jgi:hypothetical protein
LDANFLELGKSPTVIIIPGIKQPLRNAIFQAVVFQPESNISRAIPMIGAHMPWQQQAIVNIYLMQQYHDGSVTLHALLFAT